MNPHVVFAILIALGVVWTAVWATAIFRSQRPVPFAAVERSEQRLRLALLAIFVSIAVVLFVLTLRWLPFRGTRVAEFGEPRLSVAVSALQWSWTMSPDRIPMHVPIEFAVQARDVNHGFAIYDPEGRLLAQVQAMPGYTNHLVYVFSAPGTYTVRCLEYCGLGHHLMTIPLTVTEQ